MRFFKMKDKSFCKINNNKEPRQKEKIIFLDIDGVMNHEHSEEDMDSNCLYELKQIVDATGAKIVLTSSWRLYFLRGDENPIKKYFEGRLKLYGMELYDVTPNIENVKRADEIKSWLKEHKNVSAYLILDDCMFPGFAKMKDHICLTDWSDGGLTRKYRERAIEILNKEK